ncbi:CPBP family intramembrane glutamic endopeptidase [Pontibacter sp. G13]|uniref:CPBP family intramembrane glutamic endopeptidase n=1 Tax=Pontibacter sp. G13 TaxID=3074898 RepID=UPI00288B2E1A|nr:CPBP family intramembrane glutamic endopeptidase [Pontibacter sp. G13]WNJ19786.1 CPBP family intramembrane glutamic endopeptidase [Pontibacter sp. G13]
MKQPSSILVSTVVILTFLVRYFLGDILGLFGASIPEFPYWPYTAISSYNLFWFAILGTVIYLMLRGNVLEHLGLFKGLGKGFLWAFIFTLPMAIGYALLGTFNTEYTLESFCQRALRAGIEEEIFYRGFLFGLLFRYGRWGFFPAAMVNAVVFSIGHLYQAHDPLSAAGVLGVTSLGACWFAWLYIEWDNNLWVPIFVHLLMNFFWAIFTIDNTAIGSTMGNVFRVATIALSIILTIRMAKKRGGLTITGRRWLKGPKEELVSAT